MFFHQTITGWLRHVSPENPDDLEILVKILPLIKKKHLTTVLVEKLNQITIDRAYPGRLRFLLEIKD